MLGLPVSIYAQAPATPEARDAAIADRRRQAKSALVVGLGKLPTSTAEWIAHIDSFALGCKTNNELATANRALVGPLEQQFGDHWRFGFELIKAGMEAAMEHQQAKVRASNSAPAEVATYRHLLTSFQVAATTFHAFGNPARRGPSIH